MKDPKQEKAGSPRYDSIDEDNLIVESQQPSGGGHVDLPGGDDEEIGEANPGESPGEVIERARTRHDQGPMRRDPEAED